MDTSGFHCPLTILTGGTDAINPHVPGNYIVNNAAAADAMTLAAPISGVDDNVSILIYSNTAKAHTLTATGLLQTGQSATGVLTFAAFAGCGCALRAYQGAWQVLYSQSMTYSS